MKGKLNRVFIVITHRIKSILGQREEGVCSQEGRNGETRDKWKIELQGDS